MDLTRRSLLTATDLTAAEFSYLVGLAREFRTERRLGFGKRRLEGQGIALIFEGASTGVPVVATLGRRS